MGTILIALVAIILSLSFGGVADAAQKIPLPVLDHLAPQEHLCAHIEHKVRTLGVLKAVEFIKDSTRNEDKACAVVLARVEMALNNSGGARQWYEYSLVFIRNSWGYIRAEALYYLIALSEDVDVAWVNELRQKAPKAAVQLGFKK